MNDLHNITSRKGYTSEFPFKDFERELSDADDVEQIRTVLQNHFSFITNAHLDFLEDEGKEHGIGVAQKLRELYYEVIKFDLMYGTKTSHFITEQTLRQQAALHPELFSNPEAAKGTVRHRSSQTNSVKRALDICRDFLQNNGMAGEATLHDLGCGSGKIIITAMNTEDEYASAFKKAVGIDHYEPMIEICNKNLVAPGINIAPNTVKIISGDATSYKDFNGINVVIAYNPFLANIMAPVERNLRKCGGKALFAYIKPEHGRLFKEANNWHVVEKVEHKDPDRQITVFSHGFDN